jgi:hypothetical protein
MLPQRDYKLSFLFRIYPIYLQIKEAKRGNKAFLITELKKKGGFAGDIPPRRGEFESFQVHF